MKNEMKSVCIVLGVLLSGWVARAQPTPVWSSSLNDAASITATGGTIVGSPTFTPGYNNNAFTGSGSAYAVWNNAAVANIFDSVWNNAAGSTIDLYFRGVWSSQTGDAGLFGIYDRLGTSGNTQDGYYILQVRNGALRMPYRNELMPANESFVYLDTTKLSDNVTYRLTVRQKDTAFEIYLDDIGGTLYAPDTLYATVATTATYLFPSPNTIEGTVLSSSPGGRAMTVGLKPYSVSYLPANAWVDEVAVYNGYYTPAQIPEPGTLALLGVGWGCVVAFRRKQRREY
jgi:hypothetical protein